MDLLSQYKQDHPEAFQEKKAVPMADEYGHAYPRMVRMVMRLSGGRITNIHQAIYALVIVAAVVFVVSLTVFFWGSGGNTPQPPPTPFQSEGR